MEFQAHLVKMNSSPAINLALIGLIIFLLSIFLWASHISDTIPLVSTITGIMMVLIGTILNKESGLFRVDQGLITIKPESIEIDSRNYLFNNITQLEFHYDSYYSQSTFGFFTENAGYIEYGMANSVRFVYEKEDIQEKFFLGNKLHAEMFMQVTNELKNQGINFKITYRNYR